MPIELPKQKKRTMVTEDVRGNFLIYGPPKVGKTTLAASFPKCLILDLENGCGYIDCYSMRISFLGELDSIYEQLTKDDFYQTVAIDSIDVIGRAFEKEAILHYNKLDGKSYKSMIEVPYGKGRAYAQEGVLTFINKWNKLNKTVIYIAHVKKALIEHESMKARTVDLPGNSGRMLTAFVDNIGYCFVDQGNGKHRMSFQPYEGLEAGSRHPALSNKELDMSYSAIKNEITTYFKKEQTDEHKPQKSNPSRNDGQRSASQGETKRKENGVHKP